MDKDNSNLLEKLSPLEIKVIPFLNLSPEEIVKKSNLDMTSVLRALRFLENKGILVISASRSRIIIPGVNGVYYKKNHLPERTLLLLLEQQNNISLEDAKKLSKLTDNEFKVSLGVLKNKALIQVVKGKISLNATKEELSKKSLEEQFLDLLPIEEEKLAAEHQFALNNLLKRKDIIEIEEKSTIEFKLTKEGESIAGKKLTSDLIEEVNFEIIKNWSRGKKFRRYDIVFPVPKINGGKRHFVNQSIDYAKRIWLDLGFKEMNGPMVQSSFWNFDALFTAQDHPVRELHDTFYLKDVNCNLPSENLTKAVKNCHEKGVDKSKGWQYIWNETEAKRAVLRTHTTCLSANTLSNLDNASLPAKFFAIGKNFRNETVDWSHGFEFYQTEGIVIDKEVNLRHLLGYLKEFYKKMGFNEVRFTPSYFPYTEPSVEISVFHPEKKIWFELGGAGIFRPEITIPLMGFKVPVLAWGQGFDRIITDYYKIKDLRELYSNDVKQLREKTFWLK
jgi:phenylalanyl-tRNA synthetase alpha chain